MANYKAIQRISGVYQQVQDGNGLIVGNALGSSGAAATKPLDIYTPDATGENAGGDISFTLGNAGTDGTGGSISITLGSGGVNTGSGTGDGGGFQLTGGSGGDSGGGGGISLSGGSGPDGAGNVALWGGEALAAEDAGSVFLHGGAAAGGAAGGVELIGGENSSGSGGAVLIDGGSGSTTDGVVNVGGGATSAVALGKNNITTTVRGHTTLGLVGTDDITLNAHVVTSIITENGHLEPDGTATQTLYLGTTAGAQSIEIGTNNALAGSILIGTGNSVPTIAIGTSQPAWVGALQGGSGGLLSLGSALPSLVRANGAFLVMGNSQIGSTVGGASCDVYGNFQTHGATDFGDALGDHITFHGVTDGNIILDENSNHEIRGNDGTSGSGYILIRTSAPSSGNASGYVTVQSANTTAANSGAVTLVSGNAATSGTSGNVRVDVGSGATAPGTLLLGNTNALAIQLGHSGTTTTVPLGATLALVVGSTLTLAGFVNESTNAINTSNVNSTNLNTLTAGAGSSADSLHSHSAAGSVVYTAAGTGACSVNDACYMTSTAETVQQSDADALSTARFFGIVTVTGVGGKVAISGTATVATSVSCAAGDALYLSGTAGAVTNVAPTSGVRQEVGICTKNLSTSTCIMLIQPKEAVEL